MGEDDKTVQKEGSFLISKKIVKGWGTVDGMNINVLQGSQGSETSALLGI